MMLRRQIRGQASSRSSTSCERRQKAAEKERFWQLATQQAGQSTSGGVDDFTSAHLEGRLSK